MDGTTFPIAVAQLLGLDWQTSEEDILAELKVRQTTPKTLGNTDHNTCASNVPDVVRFGNPDRFKLLFKASSQDEGWMKSTKAMEVRNSMYGGCLIQVTTQQRNPDGSYSIAEALAFVPGLMLDDLKPGE